MHVPEENPAANATAKVQLENFPPWTEVEDLRAVIDGCGKAALDVKLQYQAKVGAIVAVGFFEALYDASAAAAQLNGFEFTPGYPLNVTAEELEPEEVARLTKSSKAVCYSQGSKGGTLTGKQAMFQKTEATATTKKGAGEASVEYPVSNCVGAGRIEGWLVISKDAVDKKGFGHLQSFSFEGNIVFHGEWSPLLQQTDYKGRDPVTFEVVQCHNGDHEAVNIALPEQEHLAPTPGEDGPWSKKPDEEKGKGKDQTKTGKGKEKPERSDREKGKGKDASTDEKGDWKAKASKDQGWSSSDWGGNSWGGGWNSGWGNDWFNKSWNSWSQEAWNGGWSSASSSGFTHSPKPRTDDEMLQDRVKFLQKNDPQGKEQWIIYTMRFGSDRKRDPKFYDKEFISKFFENYDNGILMKGTDHELSECHDDSWSPWGPLKRHRDNTWGNDDGRGIFFGGLVKDCTEDALKAFAETAGPVRFVKMFTDENGNSRGCGKAFYETTEASENAVNSLDGLQLMGKKVAVEVLGMEPEEKKRRRLAKQGKPVEEKGSTEEWIKLLPLSFFSETDTIESKMDLCYAAFEDLLVTHNPEATGKGTVWMVRSIIREINDVLADNLEAKQAFCMRLKKHPWFEENSQIVRWQESKQRINISKMSAQGDAWREWNKQQYQAQRDKEKEQGFGGLFAGAYVNLEEANKAPSRPESWGGGGGSTKVLRGL